MLSELLIGKGNHQQDTHLGLKFDMLQIDQDESDLPNHDKPKIFSSSEESLLRREKNFHLTYDQKLLIYFLHRYEGKEIKHICQTFGVSISTVKRTIKLFSSNLKREKIYQGIRCRKLISSPAINEWIAEFIRLKTGCFTSNDVREYVWEKLSIAIPLHQIRRHLKEKEHLSYKKGNSRPISLNIPKLELMKQLFCIRLAHQLSEIKILANIDESSFNRDTKRNYSWLATGRSWSITNVSFKGSINVISWITSSGEAINLFKYMSSNSNKFLKFLKYVWDYFIEKGLEANEIGIILDNWAIHRANKVKKYWTRTGVRLYYLPAYCPELAPVELYFSQLKSKLKKKIGGTKINLKTEAFIDQVANNIHSFTRESILKLWYAFFFTVKNEIGKAKVHISVEHI